MKKRGLFLILFIIIIIFAAFGKKASVSDTVDSGKQDGNIDVEPDITSEIIYEDISTDHESDERALELIDNLNEYLKNEGLLYSQKYSLEYLLDTIHGNYHTNNYFIYGDIEPVLIDFTDDKFYMCAYYDGDHVNEAEEYCCSERYAWIRFDKAREIVDHYEGKKFVVSFQIDDASYEEKPLTHDTDLTFAHFQKYFPTFSSGRNIADELSYIKSYIYMNDEKSAKHLFHTSSYYANEGIRTIPCIKRDGEYYVLVKLYSVGKDAQISNFDIKKEFGKYFDSLNSSILNEKYSEVDANGNIIYYGMIKVENFLNAKVDDDRYISREDRVLDIETIARNSIINVSHGLNIKVENGKTYVNNFLYNKISSIEAFELDFGNIVSTKAGSEYEKQLEAIIEQIRAQEYCYLIDTSENARWGYTLLAYYIDGTCYFVTCETEELFGNSLPYVYQIYSAFIEDVEVE